MSRPSHQSYWWLASGGTGTVGGIFLAAGLAANPIAWLGTLMIVAYICAGLAGAAFFCGLRVWRFPLARVDKTGLPDSPPRLSVASKSKGAQAWLSTGNDPSGTLRMQPVGQPVGWLLAEVTDPFALEVHRPVQIDDPPPGLPTLPTYVPREHDRALAEIVQAATAGSSEIAVLVGGSSTGKTRACWEALELLRDLPQEWRLWHPIDPSRPEAALDELPSIGSRTVVWLNEAQFYLDAPNGLGERVAAGLRELLRDSGRGPALVLATVWPQFWSTLTARPPVDQDDPYAQARELLSDRDITVPAAFTASQVRMLAGATDPRLAMAATARDGQVVQFLAGVPELLARYRNAPPAAAALINAAVDGRRLGMGVALPLGFLEAAAPGYLTEDEWDRLDEDWLGQALEYTAADAKGTRGPLTRIRPTPSQASAPTPACRLADYLDQHGPQSRRSMIPPMQFWTAAAIFADPGDLGALARAAEDRGLLRDAARLRKRAAAHGDTRAAAALITGLHSLRLADNKSAKWAATNAALDDPGAVAWLLWALRKAGVVDQVAALLARDPAEHANLNDPHAIIRLLRELRRAGAADQAEALAARAAADASLDDPYAVARLLQALQRAGAADQTEGLGSRAVAHANLDDTRAIARLLQALQEAGVVDQVAALLARDPAAHANLNDTRAVARLLQALRRAGATDQAEALTTRAVAHTSFDDPDALASMLQELWETGGTDQVTALLTHDPIAHANLNDTRAIARLLRELRRAGAVHQVAALLARDPAAHADVNDAGAVAQLLQALQDADATDQVAALLARDPAAYANLHNPRAIASLLEMLHKVKAAEQTEALAVRAAAYVNLDDPGALGSLLYAMHWVGAIDQTAALLAREPTAYTSLNVPRAVARLMRALQTVRAVSQVEALTKRLPTEGLFDIFCRQAGNQSTYKFGRESDGSAAPIWSWDDLD